MQVYTIHPYEVRFWVGNDKYTWLIWAMDWSSADHTGRDAVLHNYPDAHPSLIEVHPHIRHTANPTAPGYCTLCGAAI